MPTVHCTNRKTYRKLSYACRLPNAPLLDGSQLHPETKNRSGNRPNESLLNKINGKLGNSSKIFGNIVEQLA